MIKIIHRLLIEKKITLATAESCTGGQLAATFVSQADASKYFQGSIVCYSNESKVNLLQVGPKVIEQFGAVSCEVTELMAKKIRTLFYADCGIGVSGILGPTGGSPTKPVGTVCITISLHDLPPHSKTFHFAGNRQENLDQAVQAALALLQEIV